MDDLSKKKKDEVDDFKSSSTKINSADFLSENYVDPESHAEYTNDEDEEVGPMDGFDDEAETEDSDQKENKDEDKKEENKEDKKEKSDDSSSPHDGKYFVIPKGKAMCDKGSTFPNFKVTSHTKHYWNDEEGSADHLALTEDDLQFNPPATPFGTCAVKNGNPCAYAPAGKWTKTYDKVKVMGKSCVTELSELMCATGGKITIMKHGQQSEAGKSNLKKADAKEQHIYNPIVNFDEFQEETSENEAEVW